MTDLEGGVPEPAARVVAGRYRLATSIGRGATGTVWSGADEMLHRPVAVKELKLAPDLPEDEAAELRERALREARAMAMVTHPNVVMLYDVAWESGTPFVVMELVTGQSLAKVLDRRRSLDQQQLALIVDGVAGALQAAHRIGIVHRDVKPGNVLAGKLGEIKLGDFGLARNGADPSLTKTGFLMGTPAFLAPEAATGERVESTADLWSLGALLFHAAEGRLAYGGDDPMAVIGSIVYGEVPRHRQTGPIGELISGLMVKDPASRIPLEQVQRTVRPLLPEAGTNAFEDLLNPDAPAMRSGAIPMTQPIPRDETAAEDGVWRPVGTAGNSPGSPEESPSPQAETPAPQRKPPDGPAIPPSPQAKTAPKRRRGRTALVVLASVVVLSAGAATGYTFGYGGAIGDNAGQPDNYLPYFEYGRGVPPGSKDAYWHIEAEEFTESLPAGAIKAGRMPYQEKGAVAETDQETVPALGPVYPGSGSVRYENVDFGHVNPARGQLAYRTVGDAGPNMVVEVRVDGLDGPPIGVVPIEGSKDRRISQGFTVAPEPTGTHDVYLTFANADPSNREIGQSDYIYVDWFFFEI